MTRTALITGAAQGIGGAIAHAFATADITRLMLLDRDEAALAATTAALRAKGADVTCLLLDLADIEPTLGHVRAALQRAGSLDILVNSAALTLRGGLHDATVETVDRLFAVNVRAPFFMMQAAAPYLVRSGGTIVNITSMQAYGGASHIMPYAASKAALVALTKNAAHTLAPEQVRVFGINLGWTFTPSEHRVQTEVDGAPSNWAEIAGADRPFGRLIEPDDAAELALYLVTGRPKMMTGSIIDFDQDVLGAGRS